MLSEWLTLNSLIRLKNKKKNIGILSMGLSLSFTCWVTMNNVSFSKSPFRVNIWPRAAVQRKEGSRRLMPDVIPLTPRVQKVPTANSLFPLFIHQVKLGVAQMNWHQATRTHICPITVTMFLLDKLFGKTWGLEDFLIFFFFQLNYLTCWG